MERRTHHSHRSLSYPLPPFTAGPSCPGPGTCLSCTVPSATRCPSPSKATPRISPVPCCGSAVTGHPRSKGGRSAHELRKRSPVDGQAARTCDQHVLFARSTHRTRHPDEQRGGDIATWLLDRLHRRTGDNLQILRSQVSLPQEERPGLLASPYPSVGASKIAGAPEVIRVEAQERFICGDGVFHSPKQIVIASRLRQMVDFVAAVWSAASETGATDIYAAVSRNGGVRFAAPVRVNAQSGEANITGEQPPRAVLVQGSRRRARNYRRMDRTRGAWYEVADGKVERWWEDVRSI